MNHRERIGQMIAQLRKERGLTQEALSKVTGLNRTNIAKIENGKYSVGIDILGKITDSLGVKIKIE